MSETPFTIKVQGQGLDETAQGFQKLGDSVETAASKIEGVKLDPQTLDSTAQAATTAATAIEDLGGSAQTAAPKIEDTAAAIEKAGTAAKRAGDGMSDLERAMSGTWGQRGQQDLGVFVDYAKQAGPAGNSAASSIGKLGEVLNQVGGKGAAANDVLGATQDLLKGNERSALGAAKGLGSLIALIGTGGATLGLSALALGIAALISFITKSKEAKEAQEALAKAAKEAVSRMAELGNTPMDKLVRALDDADTSANRFLSTQLKLLETQGKIADQEAANARARIEQSTMSERDKASALAKINEQEAIRKAVEPAQRANLEMLAAINEKTDKRRVLEEAQRVATESGAQAEFERYTKAMEQFGELKKLRAELSKSYSESALSADNPLADDSANIARREELLARERALKQSTAGYGPESNYTDEGLKQKEDAAKKAKEPVIQAQQALADAEKKAAISIDKYQQEIDAAAAMKKSQKEGRDLDTQKATKEATEKDKATAEDRKKAEEEIRKNRDARQAAYMERGNATGVYAYTDEEMAAQKKEQEDFAKKFPKQTKTPSKPAAPASKKPSGFEVDEEGVMRPLDGPQDQELEKGADGIWRKKGTKPTTLDPNKIRRTPAAPSAQPGPAQPAGQSTDLAAPLQEAAQKAGDSATQSAESIQAAADAAKAVADNTKPLDASGLTSALQAAATAQQTASTQTAAGMQQLITISNQLATISGQQTTVIQSLRTDLTKTQSQLAEVSRRLAQVQQARAA